MVLNKWNYKTRRYEPYEVPNDRRVAIYKAELSAEVDCAECGKTIRFGESYSSRAIHTEFGIGYCVCEKCMREEIKHRFKF